MSDKQTIKILVVDDEPLIRHYLVLALSHAGYSVIEANNSEECLAVLNRERVDLVISDVMMPGAADGIETFKTRICDKFEVGVIIMSAHADIAMAVDALKCGALDFLEKPFTEPVLLKTVATAIQRQRIKILDAQVPHPDSQMGSYKIESVIGEGGCAVVYKAIQKSLNRVVALKVLLPHLTAESAFAARFKREARICATLSHPGIIAVFDHGKHQRLFYLAMEYIDGATLSSWIVNKQLPIPVVLAVGIKICSALAYAHAQDIVHRDIKPHNILISRSGIVKLADFGLARCLADESMEITRSGIVTGTPLYMAPEQVRGDNCGQPADIFSLGSLLYLLLTGSRAFGGTNSAAVMNNIVKGIFEPASQENRLIDRRLNNLLNKCLHRTSAERPTAEHLGQLLGESLKKKEAKDSDTILYDYFTNHPLAAD